MLAGVLTVLKIIGIALLIILAVILFLLLLVLFVPIFYRLDAHVPETDLDEGFDIQRVDASVKFSWLLFVIRGGISFPKEHEFNLRVFGIRLLPKKEKPDEETEDKEGKEPVKETDDEKGKEPAEEKDPDPKEASLSEETVAQRETAQENAPSEAGAEDAEPEEDQEEEKDFIDVLWEIIDTVANILKIPLNVFEKTAYTISRVCDKMNMIKSTLENEIFQRAFELVKRKLVRLIRMILPDKCKIDAIFGLGDPATTAEVFAACAAISPFLPKKMKVQLSPDFERRMVYTDTHMKGHITLFTALYIAATCYFNRDVKRTIRRFKKIIDS